ncbi:MAG: GMC family oxidoreductase [Proteobacteria bacterium]|nr:GMC family oxidoreductase [Pseudomonadota bacterium]
MIDDTVQVPDGTALATDVCIVGAGAAGITLALELADSGLQVLLVESGGLEAEDAVQKLYEGQVADERLHSAPHRYRQRRFGGSTTIWGGRCAPLDPIDFEARDYVSASGWPIDLSDLLPFYPRANRICEAGEFEYRASAAFQRPLQPMIEGLNSEHFTTDSLERFSCPTDFGGRYAHRLRASANVRVLLHANLTQINFHPNRTAVHSVLLQTLDRKRISVECRQLVLAAGGLEVVRILLANRDAWPDGVGNSHDLVGRYYMCHIAGTIGTLKQPGRDRVWHNYDVTDDGIYCRRRLALTPETQRKLRIGNFIGRLHHPRITDPQHRTAVLSALQLAKGLISYEYGKRLHGGEAMTWGTWARHVGNVLGGVGELFAFGHHMARDRFLAARKFPSVIVKSTAGHYSLDFHAEQEPNAASRVQLSQERDELGVPRLLIDWRYTALDVETVRAAVQLFAQDIAGSGIGVFEYDPQSIETEITRYGAYGGHHLGTARMGRDPRTSVVDPQCRVHGIDNLFVAGGAVFPTSSQANPTLSIVALAVRLAAHLRATAGSIRPSVIASADAVAP